MKKILAMVLAFLGAAALVFAIALPTYVVPKGKVIPLNSVSTTGTDEIPGNLLDSSALAAGRPVPTRADAPECQGDSNLPIMCFMSTGVPLLYQRFATAQEPSNEDIVTLEFGNTMVRMDREEPANLLSATIDRITLDRRTQLPVDEPVSTFDLQPPLDDNGNPVPQRPEPGTGYQSANAPFVRNGVQYQFPMGTDKKSYPYFDVQVQKTQDIDFVGEETQDGETVYRFEQTVPPTEIYPGIYEMLNRDGEMSAADESAVATLRLTFPAAVWGLTPEEVDGWNADAAAEGDQAEGDQAEGEEGDNADAAAPVDPELGPDVTMSRYYTVNRTVWVQPDTGVIVNGAEEIWMYYAQDQAEADRIAEPANREREIADPHRTATYFPAKWSEEAKANQMVKAKDGLSRMNTMGKTVPWIAGILGVLFLIAAFFIARKA